LTARKKKLNIVDRDLTLQDLLLKLLQPTPPEIINVWLCWMENLPVCTED